MKEGDSVRIVGQEMPVFTIKEIVGNDVVVVNPKTSDQHELAFSDLEIVQEAING